MQQIHATLKAQLFHELLVKRQRMLEYIKQQTRLSRGITSARYNSWLAELKLLEPDDWDKRGMPSDTWLRYIIAAELKDMMGFMERVLASMDAGPQGVVRLDFTFAVTK